jgi:hypothetical protein
VLPLRRSVPLIEALEIGSGATEADVELKVITPLLTDQNYLGIPLSSELMAVASQYKLTWISAVLEK